MRSIPSSLHGLATKARGRVTIRRIDPVGRVAYGLLCIAAMAALALPVILIAGIVVAIVVLNDGDDERALAYLLGSWAAAFFAGGLCLAIFYAAWPLASDWIIEWPGYAVAFSIAGVWLLIMAFLLFAVPAPLYVAVPLPLLGAFGTGVAVAGKLAGMKAPSARLRPKARTLRRH